MTSGVYRPLTWADLLHSINGQNTASADTSTSGLGFVAEADEQSTWADTATTLLIAGTPGWNQEAWGSVTWQ
ncbi:MAG TPA: hypothetical protein VL595_23520 [Pseudonocardia sp.]|jgi:hypothetical protein|nr:hypothetical protein [Pseudonocardia sp.]